MKGDKALRKEAIKDALSSNRIGVTDEQLCHLWRYLSEVKRYNDKLNLVSDASEDQLIKRHLMDSILGIYCLQSVVSVSRRWKQNVVDLGSGGGFPGLVSAIMRPNWNVILVDGSAKKIGFLVHIAGTLSLNNLQIVNARAENLRNTAYADLVPFDGCLCRAVANASDLTELTAPLLRTGGWSAWWKGPAAFKEMKEARDELEKYHMEPESRILYRLPCDHISREIVVVRKRTR